MCISTFFKKRKSTDCKHVFIVDENAALLYFLHFYESEQLHNQGCCYNSMM